MPIDLVLSRARRGCCALLLVASWASLLCSLTPLEASAVEVEYSLKDVNGVEITDGYSGSAETLQQGIEFTFKAWEYTGNEAYERNKPLGLYEPDGPFYAAYFGRMKVTCLDDGSAVINPRGWSIAAGGSFFVSGTYYEPLWYGEMVYPDQGVFIGGRTYLVELTIARDNDNHGGFNNTPAVEQTISLTIGTDPCEHNNTRVDGAYEATCTADGYTGDVVCADCGELVQAGEVISALGHDAEWVVVAEATEDADGLEQLVCARDGEVLEERVIPKTGADDLPEPVEEPSDDETSHPDSQDGAEQPVNPAEGDSDGAGTGTSGESDDSHDRRADSGIGQEGAPDAEDGAGPANAANGDSDAASSVPDAQGGGPGGSGGAGSASPAAQSSSNLLETQVSSVPADTQGATGQVNGQRGDAGADADAEAEGDALSAPGKVYRVGTSGSGGSEDAHASEAAAAAVDFTVEGFPVLWVLMWSSLPAAFAVGFGRKLGGNYVGVRRASRLVA